LKITIIPVGSVKTFMNETIVNVPAGISYEDILKSLKLPKSLRTIALVNNKRPNAKQVIHDGDELKIVSLIMGG